MTRTRAALLACLTSLVGLSACIGQNERIKVRHDQDPEIERTKPARDEAQLADFGLSFYWDSYIRDEVITGLWLEGRVLPGKKGPTRKSARDVGMGRPMLYAFTESNRLYQVDINSGKVNWIYDVGRPLQFADNERPIAEWVFRPQRWTKYKRYDEVFFVAKDHLYALDKHSGRELWVVSLPFGAASPPEAGRNHVFVGAWNDRVYALKKTSPEFPDWSYRTDSDVVGRPATWPRNPSVFAASADGNLYTFRQSTGELRRPFKTERRLLQDPLVHENKLYFGAEDYNFYCVDAISGRQDYRFGAEAPISSAPLAIYNSNNVTDYTVYFRAEGKGLFALRRAVTTEQTRRAPHKVVWDYEHGERVLARGTEDVYVLEPAEELGAHKISRIDATTGNLRRSLKVDDVDFWVSNPMSPNAPFAEESLLGGIVIMGYKNGWIVALKETETMPSGTYDLPLPPPIGGKSSK